MRKAGVGDAHPAWPATDVHAALTMAGTEWAMSRYIRPCRPGACIFFTVALADRGSDLLVREIDRLRRAVRITRVERPFTIDAWVVLPDHLHCVWTLPEADADFSTRWSVIKARFALSVPEGARRPSHVARRERAVWQRRFWEHHIRKEEEYAAYVRYCWSNPVKHGFVGRPEDWPYSSVHRDIREGRYEFGLCGRSADGGCAAGR